jgi:hypothetical protein
MQTKESPNFDKPAGRKSYRSPKLREYRSPAIRAYGNIREVTQKLSGGGKADNGPATTKTGA